MHEAWRTVFYAVDGQLYQRILPPAPIALPVTDLTDKRAEERESIALQQAIAEARRPFDLLAGPLVRASFVRLAENDQRLFITAHHIVVDGISYFQVFLPELHALYNAFRKGEPSPLAELPMQYADFAEWQRGWLSEELLAPQLAYWKSHLSDIQDMDLPTDFPRPAQPTQEGGRHPLSLSAATSEALHGLSRRYGVSLFTVILTAWKVLLYRYTGQSDVVVGTAVAGRRRPELARLIGFFANNLVLRTQLDGSRSFCWHLPRVRDVLQAAREHQDVPFEQLVTYLGVQRGLENPIFTTTCILMPKAQAPAQAPYFTTSRFDIGVAKLDLYLELHQRRSGLSGHIEYRSDLFRPETIARMAEHLRSLLQDIARDAEQPIARLRLMSAEEEQKLADFQGDSAAGRQREAEELLPLPTLIEQQVERTPDALALLFCGPQGDEHLTYGELNRRANQLAHYLRHLGVGPDVLVGLCLERSPEMLVSILGIHKAGGAYVPLDPAYLSDRLRYMMEESQLAILLSHSSLRDTIPTPAGRVIYLDEEWPKIAAHPDRNPPLHPQTTLDRLAYVMFTSGSTGRPKGVLIEHRGLSNLTRLHRTFDVGPGSRLLLFWSFCFDGWISEFAIALCSGATLVLAPRSTLIPGMDLAQLILDKAVSLLFLPPSALSALPRLSYPALKTIIAGGEACSAELVAHFAPGRRFFNAYGPTENTVIATLAECSDATAAPSIGRPISNVRVYILDNDMQPVPIGVPGELYIGGIGLARGYLNRPNLTAERFIQNPISGTRSPRLYRTGDRVRFRGDGQIDFLGRTDRQIKLRGFRIEPGEIEGLLLRHAEVRESVVLLREDAPGDKRLVAYVVPRGEVNAALSIALDLWLKEQLPSYMVPSAIVPLERLPLTPVGKIDHRALPAPSQAGHRTGPAYEPPKNDIERTIIDVWEKVLNCGRIGSQDNFFDLGGHSLKLAEVQGRLSAELRRTVPMMDLFRHPTVRELALHLQSLPLHVPAAETANQAAPEPVSQDALPPAEPEPKGAASDEDPLVAESRERARRQRYVLTRGSRSKRRSPQND